MLHHLLCTTDINILAKRQECPGWMLDFPLSGEPLFLAHVVDFSPQLLNGEQLPSPILLSSASIPGQDSRRSTSFLVVETRGLFQTAVPPA